MLAGLFFARSCTIKGVRIGVLGGTFDPPHLGHTSLAQAAIDQLELDEVIFMPANKNPLKGRKVITTAANRMGMLQALVNASEDGRLALSDLEITRGGPSYTVDTMTELQMARPADYWFLLGADSLKTLPEWKQPIRLLKLCRLAVVVRPPSTEQEISRRLPEEFKERVDIVKMQPVDISSTSLREKLARHQSVSPWIPAEVLKYIHTHRLYQE